MDRRHAVDRVEVPHRAAYRAQWHPVAVVDRNHGGAVPHDAPHRSDPSDANPAVHRERIRRVVAVVRTADGMDSVHTDCRAVDGHRTRADSREHVVTQHEDNPRTVNHALAYPDVAACAVAYDGVVADAVVDADAARSHSAEGFVIRECAMEEAVSEPREPDVVEPGHRQRKPVVVVHSHHEREALLDLRVDDHHAEHHLEVDGMTYGAR